MIIKKILIRNIFYKKIIKTKEQEEMVNVDNEVQNFKKKCFLKKLLK